MIRTLKWGGTSILALSPAVAFAAEGGMPQLNPASFSSQLVWLAIAFAVLFILMWKVALPRVGEVIGEREQKVRADLERAEQLSAEISETEKAVELALSEARSEAQDILRKAYDKISADHAKKQEKLDADLAERLTEAEAKITQARQQALASVQDVATEAAMASIKKLTGEAPDASKVSAAIAAAEKGA